MHAYCTFRDVFYFLAMMRFLLLCCVDWSELVRRKFLQYELYNHQCIKITFYSAVYYDAILVSGLSRLAQARIFFSVLCLHDELTIVLRNLTLNLFEGDRRELTLDANFI